MKILVVGSGGREHALAAKLSASSYCEALFISPGNAGTASLGKNVTLDLSRRRAVARFCRDEGIDLAVIGPEVPLTDGLADVLRMNGTAVFGPGKEGARLEGSKAFMKEICEAAGVPTASYMCYTNADAARSHINEAESFPLVLKADGLAAGKGVIIAKDKDEALEAVAAIMEEKRFGRDAGRRLIIEEFLEGEELSFFALLSDNTCVPFGAAQDHKRIGEGDNGANTGGMGTYAPPPFYDADLKTKIMQDMIIPVQKELQKRDISYRGVLFAGIMLTKDGPKLLEFNVRFGDPETQTILRLCESDILPLFYRTAAGNLRDTDIPVFSKQHGVCVVAAAKGYPGRVNKYTEITLPETLSDDVSIYHAGTHIAKNGTLLAVGGRVLNIVATADTLSDARKKAYDTIASIQWGDMYVRRDIGARAAGDALPDPLAPIPEEAEIPEEKKDDKKPASRRGRGSRGGNSKDQAEEENTPAETEKVTDKPAENAEAEKQEDEKPKRGRRRTTAGTSSAPTRRRKPVAKESDEAPVAEVKDKTSEQPTVSEPEQANEAAPAEDAAPVKKTRAKRKPAAPKAKKEAEASKDAPSDTPEAPSANEGGDDTKAAS